MLGRNDAGAGRRAQSYSMLPEPLEAGLCILENGREGMLDMRVTVVRDRTPISHERVTFHDREEKQTGRYSRWIEKRAVYLPGRALLDG